MWHEGEMIFYICVQQKGLHQDPKEILSLFFPAFFVMLTDQKRHVGWRGVKSRKKCWVEFRAGWNKMQRMTPTERTTGGELRQQNGLTRLVTA